MKPCLRKVSFVAYDEEFFTHSSIWLSNPEIQRLTDAGKATESQRQAWFRTLRDRTDYKIFGVKCDDVAIGACGLKNIEDLTAGEYWGFIGNKRYWGQGIGSQMLLFIEDLGRELDLRMIFLNVISSNSRAIRLYAKHGYSISASSGALLRMEKVLEKER